MRSLIDILRDRAANQPDRRAYIFLEDGEREQGALTHAALDRRARAIANRLRETGCSGQPVLLLCHDGLDYIAGFFGCLYAGAIAVPAYPPRHARRAERVQAIVSDCRPRAVLATADVARAARRQPLHGLDDLTWIHLDADDDDGRWLPPLVEPDTPALLQYTSGSTATPRGVIVSHGSLVHNQEAMRRAFAYAGAGVGWLPMHHDMGLIGNVLHSLYAGVPMYLMSPAAFLQRPVRWLNAITRLGATTSGGPNFAYDVCVRSVSPDERAALDLSTWDVAFCGAEPVRAGTLARFAKTFEPAGFRPDAFFPCYGLAEATLFVSGGPRLGGARVAAFDRLALEKTHAAVAAPAGADARRLVSCGPPAHAHRLAIVDPDTRVPCEPGQVGEVWLSGPSVALGYWQRPRETAETFRAYSASGDGPFLRTGDLGFLNGPPGEPELFITGRRKDLIIIRGRNHYPQDIEETVSSAGGALQPDAAAAFAIDLDDQERLAVVQELALRWPAPADTDAAGPRDAAEPDSPEALDRLAARIREAVVAAHEVAPAVVCLIRKGTLPRTSSGKVQRARCRAMLAGDELDALHIWRESSSAPAAASVADAPDPAVSGAAGADDSGEAHTPIAAPREWLRDAAARRLRLAAADLSPETPLTRYGLDSMTAVELAHEIETRSGCPLPFAVLLEGASLSDLAARIAEPPDARAAAPALPLLPRLPRTERALSSGERAMLVEEALSDGRPVYHLARACRLAAAGDGAAAIETLEAALGALFERHPALRTTFPRIAGQPIALVGEPGEIRLTRIDASGLSEQALQQALDAHARRPFTLDREPPFRASIFVGRGDPVLLFVFHHVAVDLWSLAALVRQLDAHVSDAARATPAAPGHAGGRAGDVVIDIARVEQGVLAERGTDLETYWAGVLRPPVPRLELPVDRPRGPRRHAGGHVSGRLDARTAAGVTRLAEDEGATTQTVLLAAFEALLRSITGQDDFLVGLPADRRHDPRLREVVGYLVNPVVVRADASGDPTFRTLIRRTRTSVLGAIAHQDYPFPRLVDRFAPARDIRRRPLIEAMFVPQDLPAGGPPGLMPFVLNEPGDPFPLGGMLLEPVPVDLGVAAFDVTLTIGKVGDGFTVTLQYDSDLFDAETAQRWLGAYIDLVAAAAGTPDRALSHLVPEHDSLTAPDRSRQRAVTAAAAGGAASGMETAQVLAANGSPTSLDRVFQAQAMRTPGAVAITDGARQWTYAELDAWSSRLASRLRRRGVRPESLVALCLDRSAELIAAMLAVVKAGAAYVPIDPAYPAERLRFILDDTRAPVVCAHRATRAVLPATDAEMLLVDEDEDEDEGVAAESGERRSAAGAGHAERLAYVIYTSGSTGRPKGVLVTQGNVLRLFSSTAAWFGFGPDDTWTLFHSAAFDFSVWEIWGALLHGGRLVIVPYAVSRSPDAFHDLLAEERVTVLNQTPSAFRSLAAVDAQRDARALSALRLVIFGGEALDPTMLRSWVERHGNERPHLINMYGITETTVHVTYRRLRAADVFGASRSAIGIPLPDLTLQVLDGDLGESPAGAAGELFVGGAGVARGYLNRPDLTAARFLPDPTSPVPGARRYRTGDRGQRQADGDVVYLGRVDTQIKIRGHRIEPGEIEAVLRRDPSVADAVVVARAPHGDELRQYEVEAHEAGALTTYRRFLKGARVPRGDGHAAWPGASSETVLAAYIVPADGGRVAVEELRRALAAELPEVMIPAVFVRLDRLPLTAHGKLDRAALPAPSSIRPALAREPVAPRTPVESALAAIWADVLGITPVGVEDDFFTLGGDSIRALQVQIRAAGRGLRVSLQQILQHQTIAALSAALSAAHSAESEPGAEAGGASEGPAIASTEPFFGVSEDDRWRMPAGVIDAYPLSRIQAGMFYHMHLSPDSGMYHDLFFYALRAPFDESCLRRAVQACMDRHPVLRSSFDFARFSEPLQLVHAHVEAALETLDWRDAAADAADARRRAWIAAELPRRADAAAPTQLRVFVHRLSDDTFDLVLSFHDVIFDGWSTSTVLSEILIAYATLVTGTSAALPPPLEVTYRDFVALERATIADPRVEAFWREELARMSPAPLPRWTEPAGHGASSARPGAPAAAGDSLLRVLDVPIDEALSEALDRAARHVGVPVKHVLLAAHLRVMSALSGQAEVITGLESNGRLEVPDGDRTVGIHINTVPLRQRLRAGTWASLIRQTFDNEARILPYRRYPLFDLHRQRGAGGAELVESVFNYTHFHLLRPVVRLGGLAVRGAFGYEQTNFPLRAEFNRNPFTERTQLDLVVNAAEIVEAQAREIGTMYLEALRGIAADPERRHDLTPLLPEEHTDVLVRAGTGAVVPRQRDELLHHLVEEQSRRTPDAVALIADATRLTYAELDGLAADVAAALRSHGVGPDVPVGVMMERSAEMIAALLGILKAGGAFVPLDPGHPHDRLRAIVEDARPVVLLVQPTGQDHPIARAAACPTICVDATGGGTTTRAAAGTAFQDAPAATRAAREPARTLGGHLAYIIYTSGSTGRPKAAMNSHAGIVNRLRWMQEEHPLVPDDRVLQKTPLTFDVSVPEIFWPLATGACLVMARPGGHRDPAYLARTVEEHAITAIHFVPSMLDAFLGQPDLETTCRSLRLVTCSGEALPLRLQQQLLARLPVALYNLYGPTEAAVEVSWWRCDRAQAGGAVPIGFPVANTRLLVLDEWLQPVPVGVVGELYIGGAALARGYLRRPDWTAEAFVPDPLDRDGGGRLYRTGDRARLRPDLAIEFVGRRDAQVKVRGVRVEPGEIEHILSQHPALRAAVVIPIQERDRAGLVAYVVPARRAAEDPDDVLVAELRRWLRTRVPDAMVPGTFVRLDALPQTPSGKLDRRALPAPPAPAEPADAGGGSPAVRTPTEEMILGLWSDCLRRPVTRVDEDFFDAGGDSLVATQIVARMRTAFGLDLPLTMLFETSTAAALAARIEAMRLARRGGTAAPAIIGDAGLAPRPARLPLSFAQEGLFFLAQAEPDSRAYGNPGVLRLSGPLDVGALRATFDAIVQRHETLRTTFALRDGTAVQVITDRLSLDIPLLDLRTLPPDARWDAMRAEVRREAARPFDLSAGPLLRVRLLQLADHDYVAIMAIHHIVSDGWSLGVLVEEAARLYPAFAAGDPAGGAMPPLPLQYADFALWQRAWLAGGELERLETYWAKALHGLPAFELPPDRPRGQRPSHAGARARFSVSRSTARALHAAGRREGATLFMTTLAAFAVLLSAESDQDDLVIGTDVANRTRGETEQLIGFFVNQLVLRLDLRGARTFEDLLRRVRDVALAAYDHQDLPFERVVDMLNPPRLPNRTPLFQVKLVLQNAPRPSLDVHDVRIESLDVDPGTAKFDLLVDVWETGEGLAGTFEYRTDLFEAATIERLCTAFVRLLDEVAARPAAPLASLIDEVRRLAGEHRRELTRQRRDTQRAGWERIVREHAGRAGAPHDR